MNYINDIEKIKELIGEKWTYKEMKYTENKEFNIPELNIVKIKAENGYSFLTSPENLKILLKEKDANK